MRIIPVGIAPYSVTYAASIRSISRSASTSRGDCCRALAGGAAAPAGTATPKPPDCTCGESGARGELGARGEWFGDAGAVRELEGGDGVGPWLRCVALGESENDVRTVLPPAATRADRWLDSAERAVLRAVPLSLRTDVAPPAGPLRAGDAPRAREAELLREAARELGCELARAAAPPDWLLDSGGVFDEAGLRAICELAVPVGCDTQFIIIVDNPAKKFIRRRLEQACAGRGVRVRVHEKNLGASAARNRGLDQGSIRLTVPQDWRRRGY